MKTLAESVPGNGRMPIKALFRYRLWHGCQKDDAKSDCQKNDNVAARVF